MDVTSFRDDSAIYQQYHQPLHCFQRRGTVHLATSQRFLHIHVQTQIWGRKGKPYFMYHYL